MAGPTFIGIDERTAVSKQVIAEEYLNQQRPVLLKGAAKGSKAVATWSPEWFAQTYPDVKVPIAIGPRRRISERREMKISEYVAAMGKAHEHMYLRQFNIFALLPTLLDDLPAPEYCPRDRELLRYFWMGFDTTQPLHYDAHFPILGTSNLFAQIYGRKKVILAAPDQSPYLYERRGEGNDYHLSEVDIEAPDFERFPLLRDATFWTCEVQSGDLLYIPLNYWHFMQSFGASISVSFWWHPHPVSALVYGLIKIRGDSESVRRFVHKHAGTVRLKDIEELGGIGEFRRMLSAAPEAFRGTVQMLFDDEVRAAL